MKRFKVNIEELPEEVKIMLENLAKKANLPMFRDTSIPKDRNRPWFCTCVENSDNWTYATLGSAVAAIDIKWPILSLEEAICTMAAPIIMIGEYEVNSVTKEGFKVGCTSVTWEQFDEIAKLRPKS